MNLRVERGGEGKTTTHTVLPTLGDREPVSFDDLAEDLHEENVMKHEPVIDPVITD